MKRTLFLILLFAASAASAANRFTTYQGIEYAAPAGQPLLLDLRVPDGAGPHPVILYLHSGARITGDRTGGPAIRQAARGYAVASAEYRLAPRHIWPTQVEDAKAAVRWLRAHLIPNGDHGGRAFDSEKNQQAVDDFLDTSLRGPLTAPKTKRRAVR